MVIHPWFGRDRRLHPTVFQERAYPCSAHAPWAMAMVSASVPPAGTAGFRAATLHTTTRFVRPPRRRADGRLQPLNEPLTMLGGSLAARILEFLDGVHPDVGPYVPACAATASPESPSGRQCELHHQRPLLPCRADRSARKQRRHANRQRLGCPSISPRGASGEFGQCRCAYRRPHQPEALRRGPALRRWSLSHFPLRPTRRFRFLKQTNVTHRATGRDGILRANPLHWSRAPLRSRDRHRRSHCYAFSLMGQRKNRAQALPGGTLSTKRRISYDPSVSPRSPKKAKTARSRRPFPSPDPAYEPNGRNTATHCGCGIRSSRAI